jgi:hypothetical protein
MSRFNAGERALVFLHGTPDQAAVVGMSQGKRPMRRDLTSGRWMVYGPDRAGASFVRPVPAPKPQPGAVPVLDTRVRALDDVRSEVRELLTKAKP